MRAALALTLFGAACAPQTAPVTQLSPPEPRPAVERPVPEPAKSPTFVVRVVLAPNSPLPTPLYASLRRVDDPSGAPRDDLGKPPSRVAFDGDRTAAFHVDAEGRFAVELDVETLETHIGGPRALGSGAHVTERKPLRTVPAEPVAVVGADGAPVEVVVAIEPSRPR